MRYGLALLVSGLALAGAAAVFTYTAGDTRCVNYRGSRLLRSPCLGYRTDPRPAWAIPAVVLIGAAGIAAGVTIAAAKSSRT